MITYLKSLWAELRFTSRRLGLLIIFFIGMPFLSMWIGGTYYNNYVDDVTIAVLDEDNSSLSRKIIRYFDDNERFNVAYYASSKSELEQLIDARKAYMGVYIPKDLSTNITAGNQSQVLILTDGTNVIVGNNIYAGAATIIQSVSGGAAIQVMEGKGGFSENEATSIALPITFEERMLYDPKMTYLNYLMYGIMAVFLQQLFLSSLATFISRNPEEVSQEKTLTKLLAKMTISITLLIASGAFSIYLMHKKFGLIINANVPVAILMSVLFALAVSCPGIMIYSWAGKKTRFTQIVYMLSLPTFLTCGYVWPADQMPKLLATGVRVVWPLMNYARSFDELMVKHLTFADVKENVMGLILYIIIMMPIAIWCFKKHFNKIEEA